jgi:hypothetical protein
VKRDWLQITSNIAIVIGLVIVIYELNQNHLHVRAQLLMDDYTNILSHQISKMGENPAIAIAKAKSDRAHLTEEQRIVVNAHLRFVYTRLSSESYMTQIGIFTSWREVVIAVVQEEYNYEYAREWWVSFRKIERAWNDQLDSLIDELLEVTNGEGNLT